MDTDLKYYDDLAEKLYKKYNVLPEFLIHFIDTYGYIEQVGMYLKSFIDKFIQIYPTVDEEDDMEGNCDVIFGEHLYTEFMELKKLIMCCRKDKVVGYPSLYDEKNKLQRELYEEIKRRLS